MWAARSRIVDLSVLHQYEFRHRLFSTIPPLVLVAVVAPVAVVAQDFLIGVSGRATLGRTRLQVEDVALAELMENDAEQGNRPVGLLIGHIGVLHVATIQHRDASFTDHSKVAVRPKLDGPCSHAGLRR